jgi:CheY-like chemotaxis protein
MMVYVLEPLGFKIVTVHSGTDAVQAVTEQAFDLVIMDVHMPKMHGPEALQKILAIRPQQRVLMMSSSADSTFGFEQRAVAEYGAFACLYKPIEFAELVKTIEDALRQRSDG